jgi:hypothetical protein
LFAIAIVLIEVGLQTERTPHKLGLAVVCSLARNPLIVSPIAGVLVAGTHLTVPSSAETLLKLLSGATSPCALVSLGAVPCRKAPIRHGAWRLAATYGVKAPVATGTDLVAGCARVRAAVDARPNGGSACCAAYWNRPVHARGVLSARSAHHISDDPSVDVGFARVFVVPVILYAAQRVKDLTRFCLWILT